jgi:TldD protein
VRVIHSGTWGFASSPIVTEDEIRRITRIATEVARASAVAKKTDVRLAPVQAYQVYWPTPIQKDPDSIAREAKQDFVQKVVDAVVKNKDVQNVNVSVNITYEWKYFASSEGSYIEQESWQTNPSFSVTARKDDVVRTRTFSACRRWAAGKSRKTRRCSRTPSALPPRRSSSPPPSRSTWA